MRALRGIQAPRFLGEQNGVCEWQTILGSSEYRYTTATLSPGVVRVASDRGRAWRVGDRAGCTCFTAMSGADCIHAQLAGLHRQRMEARAAA
jgi:hypothetical protein